MRVKQLENHRTNGDRAAEPSGFQVLKWLLVYSKGLAIENQYAVNGAHFGQRSSMSNIRQKSYPFFGQVNIDSIALHLERNSGPQCPPMAGSKGPDPQSDGQGISTRSYQPVVSLRTGIDGPRVDPARRAPVSIPSVQHMVPGSRITSELEPTRRDIRGPSHGMIEGDSFRRFRTPQYTEMEKRPRK